MKTRLLTAIGLAIGLFLLLFVSPAWLQSIALVGVAVLAASEWQQFAEKNIGFKFSLLASIILSSLLLFGVQFPLIAAIFSILLWLPITYALCQFEKKQSVTWFTHPLWQSLLVVTLIPTTLGALQAFLNHSPVLLILIMAIAWVVDSFAYFAGKAFGRHRFVPQLSPNKTWEGIVGGLVALSVFTALTAKMPVVASLFSTVEWAILVMVGGLFAIVGDLHISMVKRLIGIKDTGRCLPGHGGVLDRIDSLLAVLPWAYGFYYFLAL